MVEKIEQPNARPLGAAVPDWSHATRPGDLHLTGRWADVRPLDVSRDALPLWEVFAEAPWVWDYLFEEPPASLAVFEMVMAVNAARDLQPCYTISCAAHGTQLGYACYWTVVPETGTIEIGNVNLSPSVQKTPVATDAFFLMIDWAFENGYRRVEWKCNALNAPSRWAAQRLGFSFEGIFRNHSVIKGRNRDTAWFAITVEDWPLLRSAFMRWLATNNFGQNGQQLSSLSDLTRPLLYQADPST